MADHAVRHTATPAECVLRCAPVRYIHLAAKTASLQSFDNACLPFGKLMQHKRQSKQNDVRIKGRTFTKCLPAGHSGTQHASHQSCRRPFSTKHILWVWFLSALFEMDENRFWQIVGRELKLEICTPSGLPCHVESLKVLCWDQHFSLCS